MPFLLCLNTGQFRSFPRRGPHSKETGPGERTTGYGQRTPRATRPRPKATATSRQPEPHNAAQKINFGGPIRKLFPHSKRPRLGFWNQGVHVLDSVPFSPREILTRHATSDPTPARHGESWNVMPAVWSWQASSGFFLVVGTFCVAKGMTVTLLQRTTSTDFWIFQLVGTVCVTKATFVTLSLKSISQRQDNHGLLLPQQLAQRTPQRLEGQGTKVPER